VLVAGYPAADLQKDFNLLQKSKRDLHKLPHLLDNMPESYYELLDSLLFYQHKNQPRAKYSNRNLCNSTWNDTLLPPIN
jgi:hypothetical protein